MRVIVLGAGLLGVASAYYLQQLGHEVTVVDRHPTPCAKARGRVPANAPASQSAPGPAPAPLGALAAALWSHAQRKVSTLASALFAAPPPDRVENLLRLKAYSRAIVRELGDMADAPQAPLSAGRLKFYMDQDAFKDVVKRAPRSPGCAASLLSANEAVQIEPALWAMRAQLAGASYLAEDPGPDLAPTADSLVFLCRAAGVRFLTQHTVVALHQDDGRVDRVELTDAQGRPVSLRADAFVLALGAGSVQQARNLGIGLPLRRVREYVVTLPIKEPARAPQIGLHDQTAKLRIDRVQTVQGDCLRVSAMVPEDAEERMTDADRFTAMVRRVALLMPGATDTRRAVFSTQAHAVSTHGLPLVGKTRLRNLFINTAPGSQSWVTACGAGKSIARIASGLRPELVFAFTGM